MAKYKKLRSVTLFDAQNTKENLSELGNPNTPAINSVM